MVLDICLYQCLDANVLFGKIIYQNMSESFIPEIDENYVRIYIENEPELSKEFNTLFICGRRSDRDNIEFCSHFININELNRFKYKLLNTLNKVNRVMTPGVSPIQNLTQDVCNDAKNSFGKSIRVW